MVLLLFQAHTVFFQLPEHHVEILHVLLIHGPRHQAVVQVVDDMLQPLQDTVHGLLEDGWGRGSFKRRASVPVQLPMGINGSILARCLSNSIC